MVTSGQSLQSRNLSGSLVQVASHGPLTGIASGTKGISGSGARPFHQFPLLFASLLLLTGGVIASCSKSFANILEAVALFGYGVTARSGRLRLGGCLSGNRLAHFNLFEGGSTLAHLDGDGSRMTSSTGTTSSRKVSMASMC